MIDVLAYKKMTEIRNLSEIPTISIFDNFHANTKSRNKVTALKKCVKQVLDKVYFLVFYRFTAITIVFTGYVTLIYYL